MNPAVWIILGLALLYVALLFGVAWFTLHPLRVPIFLSPGALGLPQEPVSFTSSDGVNLRGWWMHHPDPRGVVVLSHGYLMNRAEPTPLAKRLFEQGYSCLLYDFRRHGTSGGKQSTIGWKERLDVLAATQTAQAYYPGKSLILWGSSMGAAASVFAQASEGAGADALILDSGYSRLFDANKGWWDTFVGPKLRPLLMPTWLFCWMFTTIDPRKVDVAKALKDVSCPVMMIYGDADLIVPVAAAQRNIDAFPAASVQWFKGVQHSQPRWQMPDKYDEAVFNFLNKHNL